MAVQISKKRKVRAAARLAAALGRLHTGGVASEEAPGFVGAGRRGGDGGGCGRMAADCGWAARRGTWRREAGVRECAGGPAQTTGRGESAGGQP